MSNGRFLAKLDGGGMSVRTRLVVLLVLVALAVGAGVIAFRHDLVMVARNLSPRAYSQAAFDDWLGKDDHRAAFAGFTAYLEQRGVGEVVPAWQLTRTDFTGRASCQRPQFLVPPRADWPHIVPVLMLVRDEIVPLVGRVEVYSSYRTADFNTCVGGASRSRHLGFRALDLVAPDQENNRTLFATLCRLHRGKGARYNMGLGAYFDIEREGRNRYGRFHVDVSGYRSWGYSQHNDSSACRSI
jgi:hypothetical protein